MKYKILPAFLACSFTLSALAQVQKPEDLAKEYLAALKARGVAEVANYMHPSELARFKATLLPIYEAALERGSPQFKDLTFGSQATLDDIRRTEPRAFLVNVLNGAGAIATFPLAFSSVEVLGAVSEDQMVHVLTRVKPMQVAVISMKQSEGKWMIVRSEEYESITQLLTAVASEAANPKAADDQDNSDEQGVESLRMHGADLSKPHLVRYLFALPTESGARAVASQLQSRGFDIPRVEYSAEGGAWWVRAERSQLLKPESLRAAAAAFPELAEQFDGRYLGWEVTLEK